MNIDPPHSSAALREKLQRERFFDLSLDMQCIVGSDGYFTQVNSAWTQSLGWSTEELLNRPFIEFVHPDDRAATLAATAELMSGKIFHKFENRYLHKDGSIRWLWWNAIPQPDEQLAVAVARDVTDRKRTEMALLRNEHVLRLFVEHSLSAIAMFDREMNYLLVSKRYLNDFQLGNQDLIGRSHYELFPYLPEENRAIHARCLAGAVEKREQEIFFYPDGKQGWLRWEMYPWYELGGEIGGMILASEVITERVVALEELRMSEEKFTTVFRDAPVWMAISDMADTLFVDVNEHALRAADLSREEVIGRSTAELGWLGPHERQQLVDEITKYGRVRGMEVTFHNRKGQALHTWMTGKRVTINGKPHLLSVAADITARKEMEAALRDSEARLLGVFSAMAEGLVVQDLTGTVLQYNQAAEKILGLNIAKMWDRKSADSSWRVLRDDGSPFPEHAHPDRVVLRTGHAQTNVIMGILKPDESLTWISINAVQLVGNDNKIIGVVSTLSDITERKQLEQQLLQAQKLEAIGTLAGGIAHDFNNVLTAIKGYALLAKADAETPSVQHEYLEAVLQGAHRATELVKQITTFSRQHESQRSAMRLQKIVTEALVLIRATIPTTIEIQSTLDRDAPAMMADATQIHQIVMNLCTNAWHSMKSKPGRLLVRVDTLQLDTEFTKLYPVLQPGKHLRLTVADNGSGMDQTTLSRIFEPFFTTKPPGEGSGLGLAVVHGIVSSHHGAIVVHSTLRVGTTFELYFPALNNNDTTHATIAHEDPKRGHGERILFVDDEPALVRLGVRFMEHFGYQVDAFSSSHEALAAIHASPSKFDLLISDLSMPGLSGLDLAEQLRKLRSDVPVIVVSGYIDNAIQERIAALNIQKVLLKPYTMESIGNAVQQVLSARNIE